jgi:hypothetical protein
VNPKFTGSGRGESGIQPDDGTGHGKPGGAAMSCAATALTVSPGTIRAGDSISVRGQWFVANCVETVVNGTRAAEVPLSEVQLQLVTADHRYRLATAHPDATGAFEVTVTIPSGVQPGPATLDDTRGNGQPLPLTIAP